MIETASKTERIIGIISLLHEPAGKRNSVARRFRGEAPLAWTLFRLGRCKRLSQTAILCWEDQLEEVKPIALEMLAEVFPRSPRIALEQLDAISASRRWADGWRGGLLGACEFDRGFHGPWFSEILDKMDGDAAILVDPSAALIDATLIDGLIDHAAKHEEIDFCFSPAAPGLSGLLLRKSLLNQLSAGTTHPGALLNYRPDLPTRDPISAPACAPVPTALARTRHRFTLDSMRQIDRISAATIHLNGQLRSTEAEQLLSSLDASGATHVVPREMVLELTVRRNARPIFWPGLHLEIDRPDAKLGGLRPLIDELAMIDDIRLLLAGVGDPLLCEDFFPIVEYAGKAGISAIAIETDLLGIPVETIDRLADSAIDIISVHLPAASTAVYQSVMGVDGMKSVMDNLARLIHRRRARKSGTPIVVPTFVKTAANFGEMEHWYDHWLRVLGCAVISGPSDYAGQIPDASISKMEPPGRKPCARIAQRLTVLSDGRVVSCEQDVTGKHLLGNIQSDSIKSIWNGSAQTFRAAHSRGQWDCQGLCGSCRDWHRP